MRGAPRARLAARRAAPRLLRGSVSAAIAAVVTQNICVNIKRGGYRGGGERLDHQATVVVVDVAGGAGGGLQPGGDARRGALLRLRHQYAKIGTLLHFCFLHILCNRMNWK